MLHRRLSKLKSGPVQLGSIIVKEANETFVKKKVETLKDKAQADELNADAIDRIADVAVQEPIKEMEKVEVKEVKPPRAKLEGSKAIR